MTAPVSAIGTGNSIGGPGAALWCRLTGVSGIAAKYAENLIAVLLLSGVIVSESRHYLDHLGEVDETGIPIIDK